MSNISINCQFDAGSIEVLSLSDPQNIQLNLRPDNASEYAQWFYFRVQGAAGVPLKLNFLNAGQSAYPKGWEDYRAVASYDRQHWFRLPSSFDGQVFCVSVTPTAQSLYLAYFEPYSHERHLDLIGFVTESDKVELVHLGNTIDGRDLTVLRISDKDSETPEDEKRKIWVTARQHPGETMAEWFVEGMLERLLDDADAVSRALLQNCVFYVVPNMNPDGATRGNLRTNAAGANLNREWQTPTVERSPEVYFVRQHMLDTGVDLFLDIHGDESIPYNFVAGTEGTPGYDHRIASLESLFKQAWLATTPDFQDVHGYPKNHFGDANLSLATPWVGQTFNCLAYTIEMPFKDHANLPDEEYGWSADRSKKFGASLLQAVWGVAGKLR